MLSKMIPSLWKVTIFSKAKKNLVRSKAPSLFLQISLILSSKKRAGFLHLLLYVIYCEALFWLKYRNKIEPPTDSQLESREVF